MPDDSPFRYGRAEDSPGLLLWRLTSLWQARIAATLEPFGLTQTQYAILASMRWFEEHNREPAQRDLVEHARIDKMTLSKAIRRLEAAGLVVREPDPRDRRATHVAFSSRGRRTVAQAIGAVEEADERFFAALGDEGLRRWLGLTGTVIAGNA